MFNSTNEKINQPLWINSLSDCQIGQEHKKNQLSSNIFQYLKYILVENLCSEILIAEPRSIFYPKNIFVASDTILSSSPTDRKQLQLSVYHFNIITFFFISRAGTVIFHTNVIATTWRSSLFPPFLKSSFLLLKFPTRTHTSRKWRHVIWHDR